MSLGHQSCIGNVSNCSRIGSWKKGSTALFLGEKCSFTTFGSSLFSFYVYLCQGDDLDWAEVLITETVPILSLLFVFEIFNCCHAISFAACESQCYFPLGVRCGGK